MKSGPPLPVPGRFSGQKILVTGAGSGVGEAAAQRFAAEGGSLIVADRDGERAASVARAIRLGGKQASAVAFDQSDEGSVAELFASPCLADGADVVCINAGIAEPRLNLADAKPDLWDRIHAVNLRGAFLVARAAIPALSMRGGGAITFTASTSALRADPGEAAYAASKAGLLGLSRSLAFEVAELGIRVNCICPSAVRTPLIGVVFGKTATETLDSAARNNPLGRIADPTDAAAALAFLASNDARHITAAELVLDGGASARFG